MLPHAQPGVLGVLLNLLITMSLMQLDHCRGTALDVHFQPE